MVKSHNVIGKAYMTFHHRASVMRTVAHYSTWPLNNIFEVSFATASFKISEVFFHLLLCSQSRSGAYFFWTIQLPLAFLGLL